MSPSKYLRLFLVLFFPLLIAGYIFAWTVDPFRQYAAITCEPFMEIENCRDLGDDIEPGSFYESVKNDQPAWFDMRPDNYNPDTYLHEFVSVSRRVLTNAEITGATPFHGQDPKVNTYMDNFAGRKAAIILGMVKGERSLDTEAGLILHCNDLSFYDETQEYTSSCYGNTWQGSVSFLPTGKDKQKLDKIRYEVNQVVEGRKVDYLIYKFVAYPMFIYLFILVSFLAWLTFVAARFVKNG